MDNGIAESDQTPPEGPNGIGNSWSITDINSYKTQHLWIIGNYSYHDARGEVLKSPTFTSNFDGSTKCSWYIQLKLSYIRDYVKYTSLHLGLDASSLCTKVFAKFQFSIINNKKAIAHSYEHPLSEFHVAPSGNSKYIHGNDMFISRFDLFHQKDRLLPNDKLAISCRITYYSQFGFTNTFHPSNPNSLRPSIVNNRLSEDLGSLLKNGKFADATILINDTEFPVHKAVLVSRSSVFAAMFERSGMQESQNNRINITDIQANIMEEMLRYMYTGKVLNLNELAGDLFEAADKYDLRELNEMCEDVLIDNLSVDNAAKTLLLADLHCTDNLKSIAIKFIVANGSEVMATESWKAVLSNVQLLGEICQAFCFKK